MNDRLIEELREESHRADAMPVATIRIPPELDSEIRAFSSQHGIRVSVLLRHAAVLGWAQMRRDG